MASMLAQLSDVHFRYPGVEIFEGLSWQIDAGHRVGLVGPNGCGKSTLLRLIAGVLTPDAGSVTRTRDCEVGYLRQSSEATEEGDLFDALLAPFAEIVAARVQVRSSLIDLELRPQDPAALAAYGQAQADYEHLGGDSLEARVREILSDLGFHEADLTRPIGSFSGGERGRIELAKVLVRQPNLLLLDEPTNHLDIEATEKLEARLEGYQGALVLVSHDRAFLNAVCTEIVEVVGGELERYRGNFDAYNAIRKQRLAAVEAELEKQSATIAKLQDYVARNHAGMRANQANSRKRALAKLEKIERPENPWARSEGIRLDFPSAEHRGNREMYRGEQLVLGYGDAEPLVQGLDVVVERGDRLGIIGPNGCGKSTLLRALLGQEAPAGGKVTRGRQVVVGFFDQHRTDLGEDRSMIEELHSVRADLSIENVRSLLGRLRFGEDEVHRPVSSLSGGERSRLALGKLSLTPHNLLALDEPTNHLDIPAREALEEALLRFEGTLIVVSHDRYFLDRVATKLLFFGPRGVQRLWGSYRENHDRIVPALTAAPSAAARAAAEPPAKVMRAGEREAERQRRREQERAERRFVQLETLIAELEQSVEVAVREMEAAGTDWQALQDATAKKESLEARLSAAMEEWEALGVSLGK
jgi:ATP-binding cassette subfamily F protein 3